MIKTKYQKQITELASRFDYLQKSFNLSIKNVEIDLIPQIIEEMKSTKKLIDKFIKAELLYLKRKI